MKRIILVIGAIAAVATAAVWFAAQESYVTTVEATIGTSLRVNAHGSQNYGLLFGQERRTGVMIVEINDKAKADRNLTGVDYDVSCNPGPAEHDICPNLTSDAFGEHKLTVGVNQTQTIQWVFVAPDCEQAAQKKADDVKTVACSQDVNYDLSGEISIDVIAYQGFDKQEICDKKLGVWVSGTTGDPILVDLNGPNDASNWYPCTVGGNPFPATD